MENEERREALVRSIGEVKEGMKKHRSALNGLNGRLAVYREELFKLDHGYWIGDEVEVTGGAYTGHILKVHKIDFRNHGLVDCVQGQLLIKHFYLHPSDLKKTMIWIE